ncbi:RHS repeat-associated core domain-containing protein [Nonomuraea sp. NPDC002799]
MLRLLAAVVVAMAGPVLVAQPAAAVPGDPLDWRTALERSGRPPESPPVAPVRSAPVKRSDPAPAATATRLPEPEVTEVTLGARGLARQAGPVQLAAADESAAGRTVRVEVLGDDVAGRAGVSGFAFKLTGQGKVRVSVDYSGFAERFGAGYADRARLVALPACAAAAAAARPAAARDCPAGGTAVTHRNERGASRLVADVPADQLLAVTAGPEGEEGSFKATPLELSGDWQVSTGSGDFSYSYDVPLAKAPAGPTPSVSLSYSSGSVDGMVSGRNTQSGPVGLGWNDFADAFVERRYNSCRSDGQSYADLCWKSDNATLSLNGRAGELVPVPGTTPKQWRLKDDPRWKIELLTGAPNGDNDGEHWKVTTTDGTQFFFGRGVNPDVDHPTHSAWTVPVFGDDPGEPCAAQTPLPACPQAWRWNLDLVIDPHDNVQQYEYTKEINHYASLNGWPGFEHVEYVRGGVLKVIKYGKRRVETAPAATVEFDVDHRCASLTECAEPTAETAGSFPDTPVDLMCFTAVCSQHSPTFFTSLRYTAVRTFVEDKELVAVDKIALSHAFPDPDANRTGDQKLYLTGIQRTGKTASTPITLPAVTFWPVLLNNRIDTGGGLSAMPHYRVGVVTNEYGGQVIATYGQPHPCASPLPAPPNWHLNTRNCFPHWHSPEGGTPGFAVFHKYVVTQVEQRDTLGGSPPMITGYRYGDQVQAGLPNGAWHHDRDEFADNANQSWSEWRGYADALVTQGASRTRYRLFRGMNADRLVGDPFPGPGSRVVRVSSLDGTVVDVGDENRLAGMVLEQQSLRGDGTVETGVVNGYHTHRTVDAPGPDSLDDAWFTAPNDKVERRRNPAGGDYVRRRTQTVYNALLGTPDRLIEHGWTHVAGDERCTVTAPVVNTDRWLLDLPSSITRYGTAACDGPEVTREEYAYDGAAVGAAPTKGDATTSRVKLTAAPTWATTTTAYDALGRPLKKTDANGHVTTTVHTPDVRYPGSTKVTNHLGHTNTTTWFRPRQSPAVVTDARGKQTKLVYDALGRTTKVYRATTAASYEFGYAIDPDKTEPPVVRTRKLLDTTRYVDAWVVHDTWLRARQTHKLSPAAGKVIVSDTRYDARGQTAAATLPQALTGAAGEGLLPTPAGGWANETSTAYDELSRPFWQITWSGGVYRRAVATAYTHDTTTQTPDPAPGGVVRTVTDAYDRTIRVEELRASTWSATAYGYDKADRLLSVRDPAGNTITNTYDVGGRKVALSDPDLGGWTYAYDAAGNQTRVTGADGVQVHTLYDALNRRTERRANSATGTLLASWAYDAPDERGLLDKSTRFDATGTYVVDVTGYDDRARPTGKRWIVPGADHTIGYGYDAADHLTRVTYPAVGGLPAETVTTAYDAAGLPATMTGAAEYVWSALYDDRARPVWRMSGSRGTPFSRVLEYDADQRVSALKAGGGSTVLQHLQFGYDVTFGNVEDRATTLNGQTWRECFDHDDLQRLTRAFTTTGACAGGTPGTGPQPYDHAYSYSVDGNLTRRVESGSAVDYTYPSPGSPRPHAPTAVGAATYAWNANGDQASRTVDGRTDKFTWSPERHLAAVGGTTFVYDADGNRLIRKTATGTTLYIDGHEITGATAVRTYGFDGTPVAVRTSAGVEYLATDNQGSVQLTVPTGATVPARTRSYQPYGKPRTSETTSTDRGWIGQIEDRQTGLNYLNARYYDPAIGRFLSPDPTFDTARPQTVNPYAYGLNNPASFSDPSGLIPLECRNGELACHHNGKGWTVTTPAPQDPCAPGGSHYRQVPCRNAVAGGGAEITSGPSLSQEEIEDLTAQADAIRSDPDELANIGVAGACGEGHASWGVTIGDGMCLVWDGEKYAVLNMLEVGAGTPYAGAGAGAITTNADSSDELLGNAWCFGGGVGAGGSASAEVCFSYTSDWERPTGVWTLAGSVGVGVGADVHVTAVQTHELFALSESTITDVTDAATEPVDDWWQRSWGSLVCFGRC